MLEYVVKRIITTLPTVAVVAVIVFMILHLTPGDPAALIGGDLATADDLARIRAQMGFDKPLIEQFLLWAGNVLRGDLGRSIFSNVAVVDLIRQRLEPTISIAIIVTAITVSVAVPLGVFAAWNAGTWIDRAIMAFTVFAFSMPTFMIGYLLMFGFSLSLGWLPVQGYRSLSGGFWPYFERLILPSVTISLVAIALLSRMTRATMVEVLSQDYVRTARAKGLGTAKILFRHSLKNAAVPVVTTIGLSFSLLLGGVVITETVFSVPGIGRLLVESVQRRDFPVIQGVILMFSFVYILINLLVDLSYSLFDPRIKY